ncbi:MAG: hypothetical protein QXT66_08775 [Nitrososphaerota archaeon]
MKPDEMTETTPKEVYKPPGEWEKGSTLTYIGWLTRTVKGKQKRITIFIALTEKTSTKQSKLPISPQNMVMSSTWTLFP